MSQYFLGQGKLYVAARDANGKPLAQRWLGDVSAAKFAMKTTSVEQKESYSGQRLTVKTIITGKEAMIDLTLLEINRDNLALALFGKVTQVASGSATNEVLPTGLVIGDRVSTKYPKISAVVVKDSATTPVTVPPANYTVNADTGGIDFKIVTGFTQPFTVNYTYAALENVSLFTAPQPELFIRYEGINLAENNAPVILELYKVKTEPLKDLALITDKIADMNISCNVLIDDKKPTSDEIGQFGRMLQGVPT
jgi:hypothetical protein